MNIIRLPSVSAIIPEAKIAAFRFLEPKACKLNNHTLSKIRYELRLIKEGLSMHGYPIKKLNCREVWRVGKVDNLYLLSYQLDPPVWVLFPHNDNLAGIIAYSLSGVTAIASFDAPKPLQF